MVENTRIEWAHHTYNLWWGCQEVSAGCDNCYARTMAHRLHPTLKLWGEGSSRLSLLASDGYRKAINSPYKWNRIAGERGERHRVFCSSMADVFDNYNKDALAEERDFLWTMIRKTPHLDWLLLTKRIGNVAKMMPPDLPRMPNVWLGISVVNQTEADRDIPKLLAAPASVRFLSCEPLLGPIDLRGLLHRCPTHDFAGGFCIQDCGDWQWLNWVIAGGESGPKARPSHPDWFRSLRDQCVAAGVPFHFKQWGEFREVLRYNSWSKYADHVAGVARSIGSIESGKAALMNADGSPLVHGGPSNKVYPISHLRRTGKKTAGRTLDGRVWDQFPAVRP